VLGDATPSSGEFRWNNGAMLRLEPVQHGDVATRFGFVASPAANNS
jgi:hypothetical protein